MDIIKRPLCSVLPLVATLVLPQYVLKPEVYVDVCGPIVTRIHVEVPGWRYQGRQYKWMSLVWTLA